jgi:hypothetical protein
MSERSAMVRFSAAKSMSAPPPVAAIHHAVYGTRRCRPCTLVAPDAVEDVLDRVQFPVLTRAWITKHPRDRPLYD